MSWSEHCVRHHKQQTDCAITRAYSRLASNAHALAKFSELLHYVRALSPRLFQAPASNGHHLGVEALVNLARFHRAHLRPVSDWSGTSSSWRVAVSSLAQHLVCKYPVPAFLASAWYAVDDPIADKKCGWFISHGCGQSFRTLNIPIAMSRRMEHIFLTSHDHLPISTAMRRAELLALGAPDEFVHAVLSTRLATDLANGPFWRTFWHFLIANAAAIDPQQISPLIDFIHTIRHQRIAVETDEGMAEIDPPQPRFSMKGRTVQSMLRLMNDWHRSLGLCSGASFAWTPSPCKPMLLEEVSLNDFIPSKRWYIVELTNSAQLRAEGWALHHCVASYAWRCWLGHSRIWSLRLHQGEKIHHVLTIEIDPSRRTVVQARGLRNRTAFGKPRRLLETWAARERLRMAI